MKHSFDYSRWIYGFAGGSLAVSGLLALEWGSARIFGPTPFAPLRDWWHNDVSQVGFTAWMFSLLLFGLTALHVFLVLRRSQYQYNKSLVSAPRYVQRTRRYFQLFQNLTGLMILPIIVLFGCSLVSSEPDLSYANWYERYPTFASHMIQLMLFPLLFGHGVMGFCCLLWRWWPTQQASVFYQRPWRALCCYLAIILLGNGLYQLYRLAFAGI